MWLQERLRRCGIRAINAIVDITNYVMMELGQPLHAFDLNKLDTGIRVRLAETGDRLTLLDGQQIEPQPAPANRPPALIMALPARLNSCNVGVRVP